MGSCASRRTLLVGLLVMVQVNGLSDGSFLCHPPPLLSRCWYPVVLSSIDVMLLCTTDEPQPTCVQPTGRFWVYRGPLRLCRHNDGTIATSVYYKEKSVACVIPATHKSIHQASRTAPTRVAPSRRVPRTGETNMKQKRTTYPISGIHETLVYR